ncbi:MAG TPA: J domain-containing protein [Ktedonobacterales bacterium]
MAEEQDYYAILEVDRSADDEALRLAYRRLAWRYHPDVAGPDAHNKMQVINAAYQALSDPERRKAYDATLRGDSHDINVTRRAATPDQRPRMGLRALGSSPFSLRRRFSELDASPVAAVAFSQDGALCGLGQLDGRLTIFSTTDGGIVSRLAFGTHERVGALQALRLSPRGALACAWGFSLGTRVWSIPDGRTLWNTSMSAPYGAIDAMLYDSSPHIRLATPDAPIALADDDPFRWADDGRRATTVYSRPLTSPVSAAWLTPIRCKEDGSLGWLREPPDDLWRVHARMLSQDGRFLLTFSTGRVATVGRANTVQLWELDRRSSVGGLRAQGPRAVGRLVEPAGILQFPVAATADLQWAAVGSFSRQIRIYNFRRRLSRYVEVGALTTDARLALSADGGLVALAQGSRLQLFDTATGGQLQEWQSGDEIASLTFFSGSQGLGLAAGLRNGLAEVWGAAR